MLHKVQNLLAGGLKRPFNGHRRVFTILCSIAFLCAQEALAQDDPLQVVAEQAAVLDAAPVLSNGSLELDAEALAAGAFIWIEVAQDGVYSISQSLPGALVLGSFPTADGRYDGNTRPAQHGSSKSSTGTPSLGPLLLSGAHRYLLSASSNGGAGSVQLTLLESVPELSDTPEKSASVPVGNTFYAPTERLRLTVPGDVSPRKIEVIGEARAKLSATIDGERIFSGGRYPWVSEDESALVIASSAGKESAPPRILVKISPAGVELDEAEPNEVLPNPLVMGKPFNGHLLRADEDHLALTLDEPANIELSLSTDDPKGRFSLRLMRADDKKRTPLWSREPDKQSLENESLALVAGQYILIAEREDNRDVPLPYTLLLESGTVPGANQEIEPNDTTASAMVLSESLRVSGSARQDDEDIYRFSVPDDKAQHLWRVFAVGATRIQLNSDEERIADVWGQGRRTTVDSLALDPGEYLATINAEGEYLLRVMDLGPRPSDYEGEPNDSAADGQRLEFGSGVRGGFHQEDDIDYYLFRLDSPSAVEINLRPVSNGRMDAKLFLDRSQLGSTVIFEPGDEPYTFRSNLSAGDWALAVRARDSAAQDNYELSVERLPALSGNEPDDTPLNAVKLPRDGDLSGTVGAFDSADQVFVPLPVGQGVAAMVCTSPHGETLDRARFYRWSDDSKVVDIYQGIALIPYGPELGGALRLGLEAGSQKIDYHCAMRFPRVAPPPAVSVYSSVNSPGTGNDESATDADSDDKDAASEQAATAPAIVTLSPGKTGRAVIETNDTERHFTLGLEEGEFGFVSCRDAAGEMLPPETRVWEIDQATVPGREMFEGLLPIRGGAESFITFRGMYATRLDGGTLPFTIDCTLYGLDDLPRPADMGPAAELTVFENQATTEDSASTTPAGPPPPGLEALIAREAPDQQPEGDLPVAITMATLPDLAAFSEAGQRFTVQANLQNDSDTPLTGSLSVDVTGEGWRVDGSNQSFSLAANATVEVGAEIVAPPWLSPALSPNLVIRVDSENSYAATLEKLNVLPEAVPVGPFAYWHAPEVLRGGLNVLHYGLGSRLIDWGGSAPDQKLQDSESALHDGLVPHINSVNVPKELAFRLAARAEVAGVMIQLRSTASPGSWPAEVEVYVPDGETAWQRIGAKPLETIHAPQYLVFDTPVTTDRLRFVFPRCRTDCQTPYVQEIQAIAVPGTHPDGLPPINAADLELGGHVVWANNAFSGAWNNQFLIADPTKSNGGWPRVKSPQDHEAVLSFHQNRAALIQAVNWVADPDDTARISEARIEKSVDGPNGPWTSVGTLPAPALGELRSSLQLETPVWARYLRFLFEAPIDETRYGPDTVEVIEAAGTSVLGLWEDDQPRAAYEAVHDIAPNAPVQPAGGPTQDEAVQLTVGNALASSVVIERNEDWWRLEVPEGPVQGLRLEFDSQRPVVATGLFDAGNQPVSLKATGGGQVLEAVLHPGVYTLQIYEPPRSVVIAWDTSGSVSSYIPRTLAAVRTWGRSLKPGRDALQLLPFRAEGLLLDDWAESPEDLEPALRALPEEESSNSELAMLQASEALAERRGARGIVIMTDAETSMDHKLWPAMLEAMPRVVSLSVDSNGRENAAVMMDWAGVNGGRFQRVIGPLGLADGMEMANALFRAPKAYGLTVGLDELVEPQGESELTVTPAVEGANVSGAVELILDASGSMLQRMEGRRRIEVAHDALTRLVRETLPEGTPFAFRAFGLEQDACRSDLIVPLGPLDREAAAAAIAAVPAINLAKTAIADSLLAAVDDLAQASPPRVVVLVTDGEETCEGDPEAAIAQLRESGLDARVNIVGFAIDDEALAETFAVWADTGGGTYFDARGAEALERSIADALRPRFDIMRTYLDGRTEVIGRVALGETVTVPAGSITITPGSGSSGEGVTVQVTDGQGVAVEYTPDEGLKLNDL